MLAAHQWLGRVIGTEYAWRSAPRGSAAAAAAAVRGRVDQELLRLLRKVFDLGACVRAFVKW